VAADGSIRRTKTARAPSRYSFSRVCTGVIHTRLSGVRHAACNSAASDRVSNKLVVCIRVIAGPTCSHRAMGDPCRGIQPGMLPRIPVRDYRVYELYERNATWVKIAVFGVARKRNSTPPSRFLGNVFRALCPFRDLGHSAKQQQAGGHTPAVYVTLAFPTPRTHRRKVVCIEVVRPRSHSAYQ